MEKYEAIFDRVDPCHTFEVWMRLVANLRILWQNR
jgi:hypothetical protein